jgi:ssDNA-binding Zn-finger/Zn-ribbon topoisomerase 1
MLRLSPAGEDCFECSYTTAGRVEHDPEPSPEPDRYALTMGPWKVLPRPLHTDTPEWRRKYLGERSGSEAITAIDQRNLEIAEARVKPEQACSDCGGEMVRRRIRGTKMSVPFCEQCECPTKPAWPCPQCGESVLKANVYPGRIACGCGFEATANSWFEAPNKGAAIEKLNRELLACDELDRVRPGLKPKCSGCGSDVWQMAGGLVECPHRNCELFELAIARSDPEAEVTELERLRCLVKTLEQEAQGLRDERAMLRAEWQSAKLDTELYAGRLAAEEAAHVKTRLALKFARIDLVILRRKHGDLETVTGPEHAESRLADVPSFDFQRGPRITYGEEG